jgi:enamine deaminase RidA (YjgF/YER057c/UK114 family)
MPNGSARQRRADMAIRRAGGLVFLSGQNSSDQHGGVVAEALLNPAFPYYGSPIKKQTRYILAQVKEKLRNAGLSIDHVVKANVFLTDLHNFTAFDEAWLEFFPHRPPCRATVGSPGSLAPGCLIQADLIAVDPSITPKAFTSAAPQAPVNYSEVIAVGDVVFAAGLMASDYKTGVPKEASVDPAISPHRHSIEKQTRYILKNFIEVFAAAGTSLDHVVKAQVFMKNLSDFEQYDEVWREFFRAPPPRTTIGVADLLVRDALIEIDLIATLPSAKKQALKERQYSSKLPGMLQSALVVGNLLFIEGFSSASIRANSIHSGLAYGMPEGSCISVKNEARFLLENLAASFESIGASLRNTVKAQVFLLDPSDLAGLEEIWMEYFSTETPCTFIQATTFRSDGVRLEIDVIAEI